MTASVRLAFASLLRNRLRTILTVLGIGIGISAVICTAALGAASTARVENQIDALGEDFLWIRAGSLNMGGFRTGAGGARTLTAQDAAALVDQVPEIAMCSPVSSGREQLISGALNWNTRYQGVLPSFFQIRRRMPTAGTLFTTADVSSAARVVVLGEVVAQRLFETENPIGRTIRMGRFPFQVIGVLATRGAARGGVDRDDTVFVPFSTANRLFDRRTWVSDIMCAVTAVERMASAEQQAATLLRMRHELWDQADDFEIQHPIETIELRARTSRTLSAMLVGIAGVSLVVGGVGIMNIMLVSVAERRREIGVRLAVGARVRDIRWQFLTEAAALGLAGAGVGIGLGFFAAWILAAGFGWPAEVSTNSAVVATLAAVGTALVFGLLPAHRASSLDPIDAIRVDD